MQNEEERLEMFATLMELTEFFGYQQVIADLAALLALKAKENSRCARCQGKSQFWHNGLAQLCATYKNEYP